MDEAEKSYLLSLKKAHTDRLRTLEIQAAHYGLECPAHITTEINQIQAQVSIIEAKLTRYSSQQHTTNKKQDNAQRTILVVDDGLFVRRTLSIILGDAGYKVLLAQDGIEGLRLATQEEPDLVLSDMQMPVIDGYNLLLRLRERMVPTRFIVFTAYSQPEGLISSCLRLGACDYINKPIDTPKLLDSISVSLEVDPTLEDIVNAPFRSVETLLSKLAKLIIENKDLSSKLSSLSNHRNLFLETQEQLLHKMLSAVENSLVDVDAAVLIDLYKPLVYLYKEHGMQQKELDIIEHFFVSRPEIELNEFQNRKQDLERVLKRRKE